MKERFVWLKERFVCDLHSTRFSLHSSRSGGLISCSVEFVFVVSVDFVVVVLLWYCNGSSYSASDSSSDISVTLSDSGLLVSLSRVGEPLIGN